MLDLTEAGRRRLADAAGRHGVSAEAAQVLVQALAAGGGSMAQFSHPELGGMGQWSQGGMIMLGDMFNTGLRARVDALCQELAALVADPAAVAQAGPGGEAGADGGWWPAGLGSPAASGAQDGLRYAWFPAARRLAVQEGGRVRLFDTGGHRITGVSQASGGILAFASEGGTVRLADLAPAGPDAGPREPTVPAAVPAGKAPGEPQGDPLERIRRLSELHREGILTDAEYQAKKSELLGRL